MKGHDAGGRECAGLLPLLATRGQCEIAPLDGTLEEPSEPAGLNLISGTETDPCSNIQPSPLSHRLRDSL